MKNIKVGAKVYEFDEATENVQPSEKILIELLEKIEENTRKV